MTPTGLYIVPWSYTSSNDLNSSKTRQRSGEADLCEEIPCFLSVELRKPSTESLFSYTKHPRQENHYSQVSSAQTTEPEPQPLPAVHVSPFAGQLSSAADGAEENMSADLAPASGVASYYESSVVQNASDAQNGCEQTMGTKRAKTYMNERPIILGGNASGLTEGTQEFIKFWLDRNPRKDKNCVDHTDEFCRTTHRFDCLWCSIYLDSWSSFNIYIFKN